MVKKTENHMKAPKCASFVAQMRQTFGNDQVTVLYVEENDVRIGEKTPDPVGLIEIT